MTPNEPQSTVRSILILTQTVTLHDRPKWAFVRRAHALVALRWDRLAVLVINRGGERIIRQRYILVLLIMSKTLGALRMRFRADADRASDSELPEAYYRMPARCAEPVECFSLPLGGPDECGYAVQEHAAVS